MGRAKLLFIIALSSSFALFVLLGTSQAKDKEEAEKNVDAGTFGLYSSAHRVATETFTVKQGVGGAVIASEFKSAMGEQKAEQSSRLELTPSMELRQYSWKEVLPEKGEVTVTPNDTFLIEHFSTGQGDKQHEQNFLLPASTTILDDYFFVQREILAWKYLHMACRDEKGVFGCPLKQKIQFGTLNPHTRSSMPVSIEFMGMDKLTIHGKEQELSHFILHSEIGEWGFWLDPGDQFKLVRLLTDTGMEVVRD